MQHSTPTFTWAHALVMLPVLSLHAQTKINNLSQHICKCTKKHWNLLLNLITVKIMQWRQDRHLLSYITDKLFRKWYLKLMCSDMHLKWMIRIWKKWCRISILLLCLSGTWDKWKKNGGSCCTLRMSIHQHGLSLQSNSGTEPFHPHLPSTRIVCN